MLLKNNTLVSLEHQGLLVKRMLIGGGFALILIIIFLSGVREPNPAWPKYWMLQPLLVLPFAGAMGGLFYHLLENIRRQGSWSKVLANGLSLIVYIFGLWIGTVLGLHGTMWN